MVTNEPDVARELIDRLGHGGESVDAGTFTLDTAAAFAKLRSYQLDDPHAYLLLLVEAGWLAGRGRRECGVEITTGPTTVVELGGLTLDHAALPELFAAALSRPSSALDAEVRTQARILQLLGLAANAALALEPEALVIVSSSGDGRRTRIRIGPSGAVANEPIAEAQALEDRSEAHQGGHLRFELRGRGSSRDRVAAERALVRARCAYTSAWVRLDGQLISLGVAPDQVELSGSRVATRVAIHDGDRVIGIVEHTTDPSERSAAWIVNRGVGIREPIERFDHGVRAIVEADLPVDLSRKQLLDGPEAEAVRAAIRVAVKHLAAPPAPAPRPSTVATPRRAAWQFGILLAVLIAGSWVVLRCEMAREDAEVDAAFARVRAGRPDKAEEAITRAEAILGATRVEVSSFVHACVNDGTDCSIAAGEHTDPGLRAQLLLRGCVAGDPRACATLVADAREHAAASHDPGPVGLALSQSCRAIPGPDCLEAAQHLERGDYPSAEARARDPYYEAHAMAEALVELGPELDAAQMRRRACEAGVTDGCAD